jgi:hypothetical protein
MKTDPARAVLPAGSTRRVFLCQTAAAAAAALTGGCATLRPGGARRTAANTSPAPKAAPAVDGWTCGPQAALYRDPDRLRLEALGPGPCIMLTKAPLVCGGFVLAFCARSNGSGPGQVCWGTHARPAFSVDHAVVFPMTHDGNANVCRVSLDVPSGLSRLRIDPGRGPSTVEFPWICLEDAEGRVFAAWNFDAPPS